MADKRAAQKARHERKRSRRQVHLSPTKSGRRPSSNNRGGPVNYVPPIEPSDVVGAYLHPDLLMRRYGVI